MRSVRPWSDAIEFCRQKSISKIDEQILPNQSVQNGTTFVTKRQRKVVD
jgi:hypothetical protein